MVQRTEGSRLGPRVRGRPDIHAPSACLTTPCLGDSTYGLAAGLRDGHTARMVHSSSAVPVPLICSQVTALNACAIPLIPLEVDILQRLQAAQDAPSGPYDRAGFSETWFHGSPEAQPCQASGADCHRRAWALSLLCPEIQKKYLNDATTSLFEKLILRAQEL